MAASALCPVTIISIILSACILNNFTGDCQRLYYDDVGPQNITRRLGESNVYIPCSIPGIYFPMWRINGVYYEAFSLPEGLIPASYGILIPTVRLDMDGWTFQCLASTGYSLDVHISTIGILTVENQTAPGLLLPSVQVTKFDLDHQRLVFTPHYKFLAWRSANSSCALFRMNASTCDGTVVHEWSEGTIQGTQLNITSNNTSSQECLNFFKINGVNQRSGPTCQEMRQSFQIKKSVLPQNNTDCICGYPVLETCSTPRDCSCGNDTIFRDSLVVCSRTFDLNNVTYYAVCFYNLTKEMNNTNIHMYESIKECHECTGPMQSVRRNVPYRIYFKAFKIIEVLPNEPNIIPMNLKTGNICFQSENSEDIQLTNFIVRILDITKQMIYNKIILANNNSVVCTSVGDLLQDSICSPFNITVEAHNQHGKTVSYNLTEPFNNSGVCSCISKNVMISKPQIEVTNDVKQVRVVINCNTTYLREVWLSVSLGVKIRNESVLCSKNQSAYFHGLTCGHKYFVSVFWYHMDENQYHLHPCVLHQNISYTHEHKNCSENGSPSGNSEAIVIGVAIAVIGIIVLLIVTLVPAYFKHKNKKQTQEGYHVQYIPDSRRNTTQTDNHSN